jgi:hypothetical protein
MQDLPREGSVQTKNRDLRLCASVGWLMFAATAVLRAADAPTGDAIIRGPALGSEIVVTTTSRLAGAIHSLTWNGTEFIDSADHGRQLQSASNFDLGTPITAETFNPTEAGSRHDGAGPTSTSVLLHQVVDESSLQSTTQMAFWLRPGEKSGPHPAKNTSRLSNHLLTKRVTIGTASHPHVVSYDVTFQLPLGEHHTHGVFEALTGYMPAEFDTFLRFDAASGTLLPLDDGPGEQADPVVLSTSDGSHAMGILGTPSTVPNMIGPTYGRFRFPAERVTKWNCVYRLTAADGLSAADYAFSMQVIVGSRNVVEQTLRELVFGD